MKAILLSIRPYWLYLIWKSLKKLELRKRFPKFLNAWVYMYCTNRPQDLKKIPEEHREMVKSWMGKVVSRFWFDEYNWILYIKDRFYKKSYELSYSQQRQLCLTDEEIHLYGKGNDLYAWHIKKLEIFDKPMQLIDFVSDKLVIDVCGSEFKCYSETASYFARKNQTITKAPQSYQYVWVKEN